MVGVAGEALYCAGADVCADGFMGYFLVALPAARLALDAEDPIRTYQLQSGGVNCEESVLW